MMANVASDGRLLSLKVSEWSVLLAGVTFCGFQRCFSIEACYDNSEAHRPAVALARARSRVKPKGPNRYRRAGAGCDDWPCAAAGFVVGARFGAFWQ